MTCTGYVATLLPEPTAFGRTLAGQRATAACDALRQAGLRADFRAAPRDAATPIDSNATPAGRALNRRTEIRITL